MGSFAYTAVNDTGGQVSGVISAESLDAAKMQLMDKGLLPLKVSAAGGERTANMLQSLGRRLHKVKAPELILFSKQFRTMLSAGISMVSLLEILESQTENPRLRQAIGQVRQDVRQGSTVHEAFARHPDVFSELYSNMLRAGEHAGTLPEVLDRLIYLIQHEYKVRRDIQSALTYPFIVVVALLGAFLFLLTFVIPQFVETFRKANIELPMPTRICLVLYELLRDHWPFLLLGLAGLVVGVWLFLRTPQGRYVRDRVLLSLPLIGIVFRKAAMSRFASIFAILQASGVPILETIDILSGTIDNAAIAREFQNLKNQLRQGRGISGPLRTSPYFTPMVVNMVAIGEEAGNLDTMLREISEHYDYEVAYAIQRMSELIGPVLIAVLAGVVGFFAMAIFLPMWDLAKMVK